MQNPSSSKRRLFNTNQSDLYANFKGFEVPQNSNTVKLNKPLPDKASIRIAFIDNKQYKDIDKDIFTSFWEANSKGLFIVSSLKPNFPTPKTATNELVKNSTIIDSLQVYQSEITLQLIDSATPDNDIVSIYLNGEAIEENLTLPDKNNPFIRKLHLEKGNNQITLISNSEGTLGLCTSQMTIKEKSGREKKVKPINCRTGYSESIMVKY